MIRLRHAGYRYPGGAGPALQGVDLSIAAGELVLVTGPTGCGKSTLLRLMAGLVQRHGQGEITGSVVLRARDPGVMGPSERVRLVGFVTQSPGDQLVAGTVADEVAFGPESAGWSAPWIDARVPAMLEAVGLDVELHRDPRALSGGQQQRLAVAASVAAGAHLLLLDEPLSQLDPAGALDLVRRLRGLVDRGWAVVMVEHRLEATLPAASRVVVMDGGRVVADGPPDLGLLRRLGLSLPGLIDLEDRLGHPPAQAAPFDPEPPAAEPEGALVLDAPALSWAYGGKPALQAGLRVRAGERVAVVGANGSGKTTLLLALAGQLSAGPVHAEGPVVHVPQDPDLSLFCATVRAELAYGPLEAGRSRAEVEDRVGRTAAALSIGDLLDRPPQALSRGQRLRTAVGAALACQPAVLLLDEPTSGQDRQHVERMMATLDGRTLVFATHDLDLALRHATRLVALDGGRVVADGAPRDVIRQLPAELLVPPLARLCLDRGHAVLTAEEFARRAQGGGP